MGEPAGGSRGEPELSGQHGQAEGHSRCEEPDNRQQTKKLSYIKLGAVPRVVEILANDTEVPLLVQSAAAVGSFACGTDAGVRAVLDSGVLPHLLKMLQNGDTQVFVTLVLLLGFKIFVGVVGNF
jgi:hypothetical protein